MLLLGIDLGTSSIKVSVVDASSRHCLASAQYPDTETAILSPQPGWAEQNPDDWWQNVKQAIRKCHQSGSYQPTDIAAIGIAYQMHGLVVTDKNQKVLRNSIIWCDSRAVEIGNEAFHAIGEKQCLSQLLNSPGNFTASKLAWVERNEPSVFRQIDKVMLPGDFISMKLTGDCTTTISAMSEGVFWDFQHQKLSKEVIGYFGFDHTIFPSLDPVFSIHGHVRETIAAELQLRAGIPVAYKAGDQPNNALSLNVLKPGEVAATAGTSGVIYGVSDRLSYDPESRINSFAHVNHEPGKTRIGILLCINGTGIFNRWIRDLTGKQLSYAALNDAAAAVAPGSAGLIALPFGNGAERMLNNRVVGAQLQNIDFNQHSTGHLVRAVQEGIAFSLRYGLDIMRHNGVNPTVIRAGKANLFLSEVFTRSFANAANVAVEFYEGDGSFGAAIGAGIGAGIYPSAESALLDRKPVGVVEPDQPQHYMPIYEKWKQALEKQLGSA